METIARSKFLSCLFLCALSLGAIFFRLGSLPLIGADEPRYARVAQEMLQDQSWVTPTLEFKPWLEKPPLYYWITIPFYHAFGISETTSRIGPALLGLMSALIIFRLGAELWSNLAGLMGATILLTSVGSSAFSRAASTDMPMAACLTGALAILMKAAVKKDLARWKLLAAYVFLGLSILAKGPVAIVLAAGILVIFWLFDERGGCLHRWHVISGAIIALAVALPWFWLAFRENGYGFIATFFINHNIARFVSDIHHHSEPFYYYLPVTLGLFFPWSAWLLIVLPRPIAAVFRRWREWDPAILFLLVWVLVPLVFFSMSNSKLPGYALPVLPPLALLLGVAFSKTAASGEKPKVAASALWLYLLFSLGMATASPIVFQESYGGAWPVGMVIAAVILVPTFGVCWSWLKGRWRPVFVWTALQGLVLVAALAQFAFPVIGVYHSTRDIARLAVANDRDFAPIVTYRVFHHSFYYYTGYRVAEELHDPEALFKFVGRYRRSLVLTDGPNAEVLQKSGAIGVKVLGTQAKFVLLELTH